MDTIITGLLAGNIRSLAKAITIVENDRPGKKELLRALFPKTGNAFLIGITGPPGAGKSTLTDKLITQLRSQGKSVGVIAVDPSSPFSGGAILGDRIRMQQHALDEGVFIRSMATRSHLGGLAKTTVDVIHLLDAAGKDVIIVETVGVGQDEVDIVKIAHTTVVVMVPGLGDAIQIAKAGVMEIADIFAVNKADREGSAKLVNELRAMLDMATGDWKPTIHQTVARDDVGIGELLAGIYAHREYVQQAGLDEEKFRSNVQQELRTYLMDGIVDLAASFPGFGQLVDDVCRKELTPLEGAEKLFSEMGVSCCWQKTGGDDVGEN
ncbi:MAG: methylmalonyl Co-A mutase-associated GTPase MeaB [Deltaproteobacteria bacterium]|nr:methylmalonyl Co-A mutase-associated GTPase MeaB [Candidatus Anaeroferrophillus wilburensis]MBN2888660.1 methylmalonyl Co-A mutase-associated GTPase MeaB [Deltaproteobacteria bacterium]